MNLHVRDNPDRQRFEMPIEDDLAFVSYRRISGVVDMLHAEVPARFGGRGYGAVLVQGALDLVRAEGSRVIPTCSFVAAFIQRHRDYQDLLAPAQGAFQVGG